MATQTNQILSLHQLSKLSKEELVLQLLKAQEKIQELEAKQDAQTNNKEDLSSEDDLVSGHPATKKCINENILPDSCDNSFNTILNQTPIITRELLTELQLKLTECKGRDVHYTKMPFENFHNFSKEAKEDDLRVAFECKGDFPNCDDDLNLPPISEDEEYGQTFPEIIVEDGLWDEDEEDEVECNQLEMFPLIPSPVLNTPPYEYIFLTKTNEAKYRIFLNQKLDKVFQEELHKLQVREEQLTKGHSQYIFDEKTEDEDASEEATETDLHNQNHLRDNLSTNEMNGSGSASNVIHCFDKSDVDLELKKIFTERPPITHRIVRRKSRQDRGSSVPAIDSYYGTKDLNKVGHASYFIPTLTKSERRAIGWKPEYHYGHWKYSTLNVPNPKTNPISLHPHIDMEQNAQTKHHNHSYYYSGTLHQNPLHHHEIDLSDQSGSEDADSTASCRKRSHHHHHHHHHHEGETDTDENDDPLSFITLSGCSNDISQSCHIIPDKSTLRRILKWILPCLKQTTKSEANSVATSNPTNIDAEESQVSKGKRSKNKKHHEIEMLVEPSGKLNFPTSQTYISFANSASLDEDYDKLDELVDGHKQHDHRNHQQAHHHNHHHHGIFHWKNILTHHGTSNSNNSMSVVGGDVIASIHDKFTTNGNNEANDTKRDISILMDSGLNYPQLGILRNFIEVSSTTESEGEGNTLERKSVAEKRRKTKRRLKPCKAHSKLLTLRDLGYETDDIEPANEGDNKKACITLALSNDPEIASISTEKIRGHSNRKPDSTERPQKAQRNRETESYEKSTRPFTPAKDPTMRSNTNNVSFTNMNNEQCGGGDDDESWGGSNGGHPFSSLSISHQNSVLGTNWTVDSAGLTPSVSRTEQMENGIETRFLDPKDSMIAQAYQKKIGSNNGQQHETDELPFVFDFEHSYDADEEETSNVVNDEYDETDLINDDKRVIEWMGADFTRDLEESLGLLSSRLDSILKQGKLQNHLLNQNIGQDFMIDAQTEEPAKVNGQHRITTLNDLEENLNIEDPNNA